MPSQTLFIESEKDKKKIEIYVGSNITKNMQNEAPAIIIAHPYGPLGNLFQIIQSPSIQVNY